MVEDQGELGIQRRTPVAPDAALGGAPPQAEITAAFTRFLLICSTVMSVLMIVPLMTRVFMYPHAEAFSPLMILWLACVFGGGIALVIVRARRVRALIGGKAGKGR